MLGDLKALIATLHSVVRANKSVVTALPNVVLYIDGTQWLELSNHLELLRSYLVHEVVTEGLRAATLHVCQMHQS